MFKIVENNSVVIPRNLNGNIMNLEPSVCLHIEYDTNIDGAEEKYHEALTEFIKTWFDRDISKYLSKKK